MGNRKLTAARRSIRRAGSDELADPENLRIGMAVRFAANSGLTLIENEPVTLTGCRNGVLLVFFARMNEGVPMRILQRIDDATMKRFVPPFNKLYGEWRRRSRGMYTHTLDEALTSYNQEQERLDGYLCTLMDSDTMTPLRQVIVDQKYVEDLAHGNPVPAPPLLAAAGDGVVIALIYEKSKGHIVMRVERVPDDEEEKLGIERTGPSVKEIQSRLTVHVRDTVAGTPINESGPSA